MDTWMEEFLIKLFKKKLAYEWSCYVFQKHGKNTKVNRSMRGLK